MVVGTKDIDIQEVNRVIQRKEDIIEYAINLVPRIIRHNTEIVNNQRYYLALLIRKNESIRFYNRMSICNKLIKDIEIFGVANEIVDFEELISKCNVTELLRYTFKDVL